MLWKMKKLNLLLIMTSCVLLTGAIFPGKLAADTVTEEWAARYNGPGNLTDTAYAIAVDSSGNVYVTGRSHGGSETSYDYATIKYTPDSNIPVWVARYNGPPNDVDYAHAIAVDSSGNVYVTGESIGSGTRQDYATIKYDPNGTELWVARYNGPLANSLDYAYAIAVDSLGNVYVTGQSHDIGTGDDYATIKYDPNGNELWVARYDGPAHSVDAAQAIALDSSGNVYVTGDSYGSGAWVYSDYATIKYTPDSNIPVWVARYHNSYDYANAIAVDSSGNVYVTGESIGSGTNKDYATIKYDPNGTEEWVARYNGPPNDVDVAEAIAVDTSGNVYVTGYSDSNSIGTNFDYATIKYTPVSNIPVWVARYNGPANSSDSARAIALDSLGNVYVTGSSNGGIGTSFDYATIKYAPNGNQQWVERYNGPANLWDHAWAIAVDSSGNVYVTGQSYGSGTYDYATIKYSQIQDPAQDIAELIVKVISLNLQTGISNSLDAKLNAALKAIDDINENNDVAAINTLQAFINAVQAQSGNKISEADADDLIDTANNIIVALQNGCY